MKAQATIEFLGGALLFLIALVGSLTLMSNQVPEFTADVAESAHNMEVYRITSNMITKSGRHNFGAGGGNWEKNSTTIAHTTQLGLASDYHVIEWDKVQSLSTTGSNKFNYSQFREVHNLDNSYFFNMTWMPVVETSKSFTRTMPPSSPLIDEPTDDNNDTSPYSTAENRIHYGTFKYNGSEYPFLVVAFNGVYDTVYFTGNDDDWKFFEDDEYKVGDRITMQGREFKIEKIQNRERTPGAAVILKNHLKSFGSPRDSESTTIKLNRYVSLEAPNTDRGVVRMEVLSYDG